MLKKIFIYLVLTSTLILSSLFAEETKTIRVLTVGNSFAGDACYYLRQITASVPGCKIAIGGANLAGSDLRRHANFIKECETDPSKAPYGGRCSLQHLLQQKKWDVVTIQQATYNGFKAETFQPHADVIVAYIKKHAPDAEILLHQTWAYAPDCNLLKRGKMSREEMHEGLIKNYHDLAKHFGGLRQLKSGAAFERCFKANPDIDLWNEKTRHYANFEGSYLLGCVWFSELFGISPEKITYVPRELKADVAAKLRKAADNSPATAPKEEKKTIRVLNIGDIFTKGAYRYLGKIAESVQGRKIEITNAHLREWDLAKHAKHIKQFETDPNNKPYRKKYTLKEKLQLAKWDVVTIQQVSTLSFRAGSFQPHADEIVAFIKKHAPDSEILIHQTWAYPSDNKRLKRFKISREQMHERLTKNYNDLAKHFGGLRQLKSGAAFYRCFEANPDIDLWSGDRLHANREGRFLLGCVWFSELFGISPEKITFVPRGMKADVAATLRKAALSSPAIAPRPVAQNTGEVK